MLNLTKTTCVAIFTLITLFGAAQALSCLAYSFQGVTAGPVDVAQCASNMTTCFRIQFNQTSYSNVYATNRTYTTYGGDCGSCSSYPATFNCVPCSTDRCNWVSDVLPTTAPACKSALAEFGTARFTAVMNYVMPLMAGLALSYF